MAVTDIYDTSVNRYTNPILEPFDAVTPLTPQDYLETWGARTRGCLSRRIKELNFGRRLNCLKLGHFARPTRVDYADVVEHALEDMPDEARFLPCVLPNWDNTPRSGLRGVVYENATPPLYRRYLEKAIGKVARRTPEQTIVFLKAWNEWAEGNYLEPDMRYGHAYLDLTREVMMVEQFKAELPSEGSGA